MRRITTALAAAALLGGGAGIAAAAGDPGADHNCAGATVSGGAGPGFGQVVAGAAHAQLVDNFGLANCGRPPRQNPL
jgi:hypothetical protein